MDAIDIGSRLELMIDDYLIEKITGGGQLRLHHPRPREPALVTDRPWEGSMCGYITVLGENDLCRMYYKASQLILQESKGNGPGLTEAHPMWVCCAESNDGIDWRRPEFGLVEYDGSSDNNIIWQGAGDNQHGIHGFSPVRDDNPDCEPEARYKAVGGDRYAVQGHLYAVKSSDGIHWSLLTDEPILRQGVHGKFDSQNVAFWDSVRGNYRIYLRETGPHGRDIATATSDDFVNWTQPELLEYPSSTGEQLYTNQVQPYYRAPHIFVGFPTRYIEREWSPAIEDLPEPGHRRLRADINERFGAALTDGLFMSSRDGRTFNRHGDAFIRPGPQLQGNWAYGDNYQCWGMLQTPSALDGAPPELSFFVTEGHWRGASSVIRRYTLRIDGFVSLNAGRAGAECITKPVVFSGSQLHLNFATSAAGNIRVEIQDADGNVMPGFGLQDCYEVIGDELSRVARWEGGSDLSEIQGRPVRLRIVMQDADLYSLQFT